MNLKNMMEKFLSVVVLIMPEIQYFLLRVEALTLLISRVPVALGARCYGMRDNPVNIDAHMFTNYIVNRYTLRR
jgi:hypothetical protein